MPNQTFLSDIHAFRGFAILTIVGAHAWSFLIFWTGSLDDALKPVFWLTESLFHGSTLYFAIISGILFQRVLLPKILHSHTWKDFYQSKFFNVLLPYLFMSLLYTALYWQYQAEAAAQRGEEISFWFSFLSSLPGGNASIHFWYIPLLLFLFAITPLLHLLYQKAAWSLCLLALLPLVVSRSPFPDFLLPQSFVYFTGAYALGMLIGAKGELIMHYVARYWFWLLAATFTLTGALYWQYMNGYQPDGWFSLRQTLVYLQKVCVSLLLLWSLQKLAGKSPDTKNFPRWIMLLGDYAFAIFFLHVLFIGFFIQISMDLLQSERNGLVFLSMGMLNLLVSVVLSLTVAVLLKKLFKSHARKIVGA